MTSVPQLLNFAAVAAGTATGGKNSAQAAGPEGLIGQAGGEQAGQGEERIDFGALLRDLVLEGMIPEEFNHPFTVQVPGDEQQGTAGEGVSNSTASAGSESAEATAAGEAPPLAGALADMLQGALQQLSQLSAASTSSSQVDGAQSVVEVLTAITQAAGVKGHAHTAAAEAVTSGETALPAQLVAMLRNARSGAAPQARATSADGETSSSPTAPAVTTTSNALTVNVSRETPAALAQTVVTQSESLTSGEGEAASRPQSGAASQSDLAQRMTAGPVATEMMKDPIATNSSAANSGDTRTVQASLSSSAPAASGLLGSQPAAQVNGQVSLDSAPTMPTASNAAGAASSATASSTAGQAQAAAGVNASSPAAPPTSVAAAHTTSPTAPTAPPAAVELARQVSAKFGALREMGSGTHQLSIKVTPEEFGPIRVVARIEAGSVGIDLHTASATGRELLKAAMADIRRDLPPNLASATVNVADSGSGHGGSAQGGSASAGQQNTSQGGSSFDGRGTSRGDGADSSRDQQHRPGAEQETAPYVTGYEGGVDVLT